MVHRFRNPLAEEIDRQVPAAQTLDVFGSRADRPGFGGGRLGLDGG